MNKCEVCSKEVDRCIPSPFSPYSYWRCDDCCKAKRVAYNDLVMAGTSNRMYEELGEDYFDCRMKATLSFLKISESQFWRDVHDARQTLL